MNDFKKSNPLAEAAKKIMQENAIRRQVEKSINESLGIESRKALPLEHLYDYDKLLEEKIADALKEGLDRLPSSSIGADTANKLQAAQATMVAKNQAQERLDVGRNLGALGPKDPAELNKQLEEVHIPKSWSETMKKNLKKYETNKHKIPPVNKEEGKEYGVETERKMAYKKNLEEENLEELNKGSNSLVGRYGRANEKSRETLSGQIGVINGKPSPDQDKLITKLKSRVKFSQKANKREFNESIREGTSYTYEEVMNEIRRNLGEGAISDFDAMLKNGPKDPTKVISTPLNDTARPDSQVPSPQINAAVNKASVAAKAQASTTATIARGGRPTTVAGRPDALVSPNKPNMQQDVAAVGKNLDYRNPTTTKDPAPVSPVTPATTTKPSPGPADLMRKADSASMKNVNVADLNRIRNSKLSDFGKAFQTARLLQGIKADKADSTGPEGKAFSYKGKLYSTARKDELHESKKPYRTMTSIVESIQNKEYLNDEAKKD